MPMDQSKDDADGQGEAGWFKRYLPLIVLAAVAALVLSQGWHKYLTLEHIAANRDLLKGYIANNYLLTLLSYMAIYIAAVALSLPGGVFLTLLGGFLFGWLVGGTATVIAATIGATIIFLIAKTSFGETLAARAGPWLGKLREGFQEDGLSYLLFLRLVPLFPFWLVKSRAGAAWRPPANLCRRHVCRHYPRHLRFFLRWCRPRQRDRCAAHRV